MGRRQLKGNSAEIVGRHACLLDADLAATYRTFEERVGSDNPGVMATHVRMREKLS